MKRLVMCALLAAACSAPIVKAAPAALALPPPAAAPSALQTQPPDDIPVEPVAQAPGSVRFAFYGRHAPPQVAGCPLVYPQSATEIPTAGVYHNQFTLTFADIALSEIAIDSRYQVEGAVLRHVASGTVYAVAGREGDEETWISNDGRCLVHVLRLTDSASAYDTQAAAVTLAPVK